MAATIQAAGADGARKEAERPEPEARAGVSKLKLAVGAASLFLFLIGVKRSFHTVGAIGEEKQPGTERKERERTLR